MTKISVWDRLVEIEFEGSRIGWASTERPDQSLRWTEIHIYRTRGGSYVIERLGRSLVYHARGTDCARGRNIVGSQISDESEPCEKCRPNTPEDDDFNPHRKFVHEVTMSSADVVDDPSKVHDALSQFDKQRGVKRISRVASNALQAAAANDPVLLNSLLQKRVID